MADIKVGGFQRGPGPGDRFQPKAHAKDAKGTMMRIVRIYMQWKGTIFFALILTLIASSIGVGVPFLVGKVFNTFNTVTHVVDSAPLIAILLILCVVHVMNWLVSTTSSVIMLKLSQRLVQVLRKTLFEKMQRLPLSFYDTRSHGDTMSRITNDVDNISSTIAQTTTQLISSILTLVGSLVVMLMLNIPLTLTVLICIPLVIVLTKVIATKSRAHFLAQQRSLGALNGQIEEDILNIKMVKAFCRKQAAIDSFSEVNNQLYESSKRAQIWAGYLMPLMNVINNLIFTLVVIVGGILSVQYGLAIGTVISFLNYSKQFSMSLNGIAGMFNTIQSALASAERVFEMLDEHEEVADHTDAVILSEPKGAVTFKDVCFSYDANKPILNGVSFDVTPGETIAIVGETGAGKTTIVNLLTRFYDADSGSITIDGVDITDIERNNLRQCFSVVLQETCLFTGTIMDNIRYSKPYATDAQAIEASRLAHADGFIRKLPHGYQTMVSGSTDNLSQGQRQLLAIARAVVCNSPILILDEATSSVDTKTEKDIQRALLRLMSNRTSFLVAHRLSTIRDADRIMVIGDGTILEMGNHDELMEQHGRYYDMVVSQIGKEL